MEYGKRGIRSNLDKANRPRLSLEHENKRSAKENNSRVDVEQVFMIIFSLRYQVELLI